VAALVEVQIAVELVGGLPDRPLVSPPDDDTTGRPPSARPTKANFDKFGPSSGSDAPAVDPEDRDALSRMVGDAVGQALRPLQPGAGS
jgi:hypothetical protein